MFTLEEIIKAKTPAHLSMVHAMFSEYAASLGLSLCFQGFAEELASLPGSYSEPAGCLLLATVDLEPAGCVGLRKLSEKNCEMKRLYVRPQFRGSGLGRKLAAEVITEAHKKGYEQMCLDTLSTMQDAVKLYNSLGFRETSPYCYNPMDLVIYMELDLRQIRWKCFS